jgi:hypothetical protein
MNCVRQIQVALGPLLEQSSGVTHGHVGLYKQRPTR